MDHRHFTFHLFRSDAEQVPAAFFQLPSSEPEQIRLKRSRNERQLFLVSSNLPTLNKYLLIESNPDGLPRHCGCRHRFSIEGLNRPDIRPFIGGREHKVVTDFEPSRRNASRKNAPGIELIDVLNRETKRLLGTHHLLVEHAEGIEHRGALIPC